jgi:5'-nucleotidase
MMRRILSVAAALMVSSLMYAQDLTVLHMNDTHSHIDPQRSGEYIGRGGVIEQAAFIDSVRVADGKRNVLLLHAGDFGQGTSYFTELNGDIEIDVLNSLGFDVVCLGNHEFDNGIAELARRLGNLDAEVVCANYDFSNSALKDLVKPYTIVRKAGKKIGIIGLLTDVRRVVDKGIADDFVYQEPSKVVNEYADYLKNEKKCDLVLCLSHLGYEEDKEVAASVRNVDAIVGGHSHTLLHKKQVVRDLDGKEVVIVQNWKWGLNVGVLEITF